MKNPALNCEKISAGFFNMIVRLHTYWPFVAVDCCSQSLC